MIKDYTISIKDIKLIELSNESKARIRDEIKEEFEKFIHELPYTKITYIGRKHFNEPRIEFENPPYDKGAFDYVISISADYKNLNYLDFMLKKILKDKNKLEQLKLELEKCLEENEDNEKEK